MFVLFCKNSTYFWYSLEFRACSLPRITYPERYLSPLRDKFTRQRIALEGLEAPCRRGIPLERKIQAGASHAPTRFFFSSLGGYIPLAVRLTPLSLRRKFYETWIWFSCKSYKTDLLSWVTTFCNVLSYLSDY